MGIWGCVCLYPCVRVLARVPLYVCMSVYVYVSVSSMCVLCLCACVPVGVCVCVIVCGHASSCSQCDEC